MQINVNLGERSYGITVERGCLSSVAEYIGEQRRIFVLTDSGVPREYAETVATAKHSMIYTVPEGEGAKSPEVLFQVLGAMLEFNMTRSDAVVAVGGGVVGDLGGFAASVYMRGVDFYNVPTTLLSMVDSSVGGKTAINFSGVKNTVGTFYQPKHVFIDANTLKTLPDRHFSAGACEAVKMAICLDAELFSKIESAGITEDNVEEIITRAIEIKKNIVERDEREGGLRRVLNFGHTLGHGIEAISHGEFYHGECVALGMIPMCAPYVRERLIAVLRALNLPTEYCGDIDAALAPIEHDKKCEGDEVAIIKVEKVGKFTAEKITTHEFKTLIKKGGL
ncbi:MAG: 3-dehydroquinate synthase [Clostridia bacterium]|nr:3-dehydroquinate synthase [Clostridia bacterium]